MLKESIRIHAGESVAARRTWPRVNLRIASVILVTLMLCSCTVIRARPSDAPGLGIEASGLIDGYATLGFSDEERLLSIKALGGSNRGAVAEFALWKLLYLEVGLAGAAIGVGPIQVGLGSFLYSPQAPVSAGDDCESDPCPAIDQDESDQQEQDSLPRENSAGVL